LEENQSGIEFLVFSAAQLLARADIRLSWTNSAHRERTKPIAGCNTNLYTLKVSEYFAN
jgi:hypothetical protein